MGIIDRIAWPPGLSHRDAPDLGLDPATPVVEEEEPIPAGRLERMDGLDVETLSARSTQFDRSEANGSIALLAEWADRSCLLTRNAHAAVLRIRPGLLARLRLDACRPREARPPRQQGQRHEPSDRDSACPHG